MWSIAALVLFVFLQWSSKSSLAKLVLEFHQPHSEARVLYASYFADSIRRNQAQALSFTASKDQPNLFIFQLESLNAALVNQGTTPRLLDIAQRDGVLFSRVQSSSVFTILSMETLLCSVLPTVDRNLSRSQELFGTLQCLPEIMRRMGYKTVYFQNFPNLEFANMDKFLESIGFEERHGANIMKPEDAQISWGYLEDVYYQRVFEYLQRYKGQKLFAYILVGATNHYPFQLSEAHQSAIRAEGGLPYPAPDVSRQQVANTTFLQDYYFGRAYEQHFKPAYGAISHAVVLGDHSWPLGMHVGNDHNLTIEGAYQENFLTALALLPAADNRHSADFARGKRIAELRTQLDFLPTILEIYQVSGRHYYGSSFAKDLIGQEIEADRRSCLVSVQPFAGGSIAVLRHPFKHVYHLRSGTVKSYDLVRDPEEHYGIKDKIDSAKLKLLEQCLASIRDANGRHRPGT